MNEIVPAAGPFSGTDTGLVLQRQPSYEEWDALGVWLSRADKSLAWLVGDWLNYGTAIFGEVAYQHFDPADSTGWQPKTLEVYAWVCRQVAPERRRADLTFAHHQAVAALDPEQQTRWLERAATDPDGAWSVRELKAALKVASGELPQVWVLVSALDHADAEWLCGKFLGEGRSAKVVERT